MPVRFYPTPPPTPRSPGSTHLGVGLPAFQLLCRGTDTSSRVTRESKGLQTSPQSPGPPPPKCDHQGRRTRKGAERLTPFSLRGTSPGKGLQPPEQRPHTHPSALACTAARTPAPRPSLTLRTDTREDAGVQQASGRVGAHLTHEGEPSPPPHAVLLHLLPAGQTGGQCWRSMPWGTGKGQGSAVGRRWRGGGEGSPHFSPCVTKWTYGPNQNVLV